MVSPFLKQCWIASGVLMNILGTGMVLTYPASLLPGLRAPDSPIKVDLDSASLLASCIGLSACIGFLACSFLMEIYGRKWTHLVTMLPSLVGWVLISFATNFSMLMTGRLLGGVTAGGTVTLGAVVLGEYTSPVNRGLFLNLKTAATCLGSLILHVLAHYYSWRTVALIGLVPILVSCCNILTWPESPSWLASKNRYEESEKAFYWLRGRSEDSVKEFVAMTQAQKKRAQFTAEMTCSETVINFFKKLGRKDFILPVVVVFFSFTLLEACGRHVFPAYALEIIGNVRGDSSSSETFMYTLCMDLIITGSVTFSCVLVKIMNRRSLLFFSGISSVIVLLSVSLYLYLADKGIVANDKPWIPCSMLVVYFILSNLGCTSIPLALLGEVFPLPHRGAGSGISGLTMSFALVLSLQMTPRMMESINVYGTFTVFAAFMVLSLIILYFILPETKNRTLQEIEDYFNHGRFLVEGEKVGDDETRLKMLNVKA